MGLEDQHALNGAGHFVPQVIGRWWDGSDISASMTTRCHDQFMPDKGNFAAVVQPFSPHGHYRYEASEHAATLQDRENRQGGHTHLVAIPLQDARDLAKAQNGLGIGSDGDPSYTLDRTGAQSIAIGVDVYNGVQTGDVAATVTSATGSYENGGGQVAVATPMVVRRLTPFECERLQGFPDGWTDVGTPEKPTADSHRYKQLGNAVTVNVAEWLAHRVAAVLTGQQ